MVEKETMKLSSAPDFELLRSARESGVVSFYPRADEKRLLDIIQEIRHASGTLEFAGVALPTGLSQSKLKPGHAA